MSVLDASVVVDALIVAGPSGDAAKEVLDAQPIVEAPAILKAEAVSAMRRFESREELATDHALAALDRLSRLGVRSYPVDPFLPRIWELRATVSAYDAWYVALAEELGTDLLTMDGRLASAPGPWCPILVVGS